MLIGSTNNASQPHDETSSLLQHQKLHRRMLEENRITLDTHSRYEWKHLSTIGYMMMLVCYYVMNYSISMVCITKHQFEDIEEQKFKETNYVFKQFMGMEFQVGFYFYFFVGKCVGSVLYSTLISGNILDDEAKTMERLMEYQEKKDYLKKFLFTIQHNRVFILRFLLIASNLLTLVVNTLFFLVFLMPFRKNDSSAYFILALRFVVGISAGNSGIARHYIGLTGKKRRFQFLLLTAAVEFLGYSLGPPIGLSIDKVGSLIPGYYRIYENQKFDFGFLSTWSFVHLILIFWGVVMLLWSFFVFPLPAWNRVQTILDPKILNIGPFKFAQHKVLRLIMLLCWVLVFFALSYCLLVFNKMEIFLGIEFNDFETRGNILLFVIPIGFLGISLIIYPMLSYATGNRFFLQKTLQGTNFFQSNIILRYKALSMFFLCVLSVGYGMATGTQFIQYEYADVLILCIFGGIVSVVLPFTISLVWYCFLSTLENMFQSQRWRLIGLLIFLESLFSSFTVYIMYAQKEAFIFSNGFIILAFGLFCMSMITLLSVNNVVGVIVMHHAKTALKFGQMTVKCFPTIVIEQKVMSLLNNRFDLYLDNQRRIIVKLESEKFVEDAVYFHRYFQHNNILRLKGHHKLETKSNYVVFDHLKEKYNLTTLAKYYSLSDRPDLKWNEKISLAVKITSAMVELHDAYCVHGYLSSWNILIYLDNEHSIQNVKMIYLGKLNKLEDDPFPFDEPSSITDINQIGLFLLELFEEKTISESSYRMMLMNDRKIDIPMSGMKAAIVDTIEYDHSYRCKQWQIIQQLLKDCWKVVPSITCQQIIQQLLISKYGDTHG